MAQDPSLEAYHLLQGRLLEALDTKDPAGHLLEAGMSEDEIALLSRMAGDVRLMGAEGPRKWLPNLARELIEELNDVDA
jgi:hypothetical protein